jgi:hypothetical protein
VFVRAEAFLRFDIGVRVAMKTRTHQFLTQAALSRRLDLPQARVAALIKAGRIKPDAVAGRSQLFDPRRIESLAEQIPGARILAAR